MSAEENQEVLAEENQQVLPEENQEVLAEENQGKKREDFALRFEKWLIEKYNSEFSLDVCSQSEAKARNLRTFSQLKKEEKLCFVDEKGLKRLERQKNDLVHTAFYDDQLLPVAFDISKLGYLTNINAGKKNMPEIFYVSQSQERYSKANGVFFGPASMQPFSIEDPRLLIYADRNKRTVGNMGSRYHELVGRRDQKDDVMKAARMFKFNTSFSSVTVPQGYLATPGVTPLPQQSTDTTENEILTAKRVVIVLTIQCLAICAMIVQLYKQFAEQGMEKRKASKADK